MYCKYYQAKILKKKTWFLSAVLRNESNLVFARAVKSNKGQDLSTVDGFNPIFEFFVTRDQEALFLAVMETLQKRGVVLSLEKKQNRFID